MGTITEAQLAALWKNGVDLARSWVTYANPDLKARWLACQKRSAATAFADAVTAAATDAHVTSGNAFEKVTNALAPANEIIRERTALQAEMRAAILDHLRTGQLFAYGFEPPRKLASVPVALPVSVWTGKIEWDLNRVTHAGLTFEQVRLTTRRIRNTILERGHVTAAGKTLKVGRPSVGEQITTICNQLVAEGLVDTRRSQKSHFPAIRESLNNRYPDQIAGFGQVSDKTIGRYFSNIFKDLKEKTKL